MNFLDILSATNANCWQSFRPQFKANRADITYSCNAVTRPLHNARPSLARGPAVGPLSRRALRARAAAECRTSVCGILAEMAAWQPDEYLRFEQERTRPCLDLVNRIEITPCTAIDLGCGPGNSTAVLAQRWPAAQIIGLDSSESMLRCAPSGTAHVRWVQEDIAKWAYETEPQFDLVFSNAALQWVDEHATIFPSLMRRVAHGGVLAVQMPADVNAPAHRIMRERFPGGEVREWFVHDPPFYYDLLSGHARTIQLWTTEYLHVLPTVEAIADWYRSTGLRPFLQALTDDRERERFVRDYITGLHDEFQVRPDGRVLFPFRRLFIVAER